MSAHPTADEIRLMTGEQLGELALTLGLAPAGVYRPEGCEYFYDADELTWRPWSRIAQADAILRQLRAQGWTIEVFSSATGGYAHAGKRREPKTARVDIDVDWPTEDDPTEALALLRCACLAVASERQT